MILSNLGPTEESVSNNYRKVDQENEEIFSNAVSDQNTLSIYSLNKGVTKQDVVTPKTGLLLVKMKMTPLVLAKASHLVEIVPDKTHLLTTVLRPVSFLLRTMSTWDIWEDQTKGLV